MNTLLQRITGFSAVLALNIAISPLAQAAIHPSHPEYRKDPKAIMQQRTIDDVNEEYDAYQRNPYRSANFALHPYNRKGYYDLWYYEQDPYYRNNRFSVKNSDHVAKVGTRCYNSSSRRDNYRMAPMQKSCTN